jgi:UDP-N-acetylmuramate: L-alanyl-gamma-D-glutamyl-meso-diaminopimelate ligase
MQNLSAAKEACIAAGIPEDGFYDAIQSFEGTSGRLQKLMENENGVFFYDFAHSPSKVRATVEAVAARYPGRTIIACFELHTFSSLSSAFLPFYKGTLEKASRAFVYFNPHQFEIKKLEPLSKYAVKEAFSGQNLTVYDDSAEMIAHIKSLRLTTPVYLFMSSGDFNGCDLKLLAGELLGSSI